MTSRSLTGLTLTIAVLVAVSACERDLTDLDPAEFPADAEVFLDGYAQGVSYQAFAGSKTDAVVVDQSVFYQGSSALRIDVPATGYAGGAFTSNTPRNLTEYNALTFWARASIPASLNVAGLGNDNTGTSLYTAETTGLQLTTSWQQYAIPVPLASKLDQEAGLFYFAEDAEGGNAYTIWIDEMQFANLSTISNPRPVIADRSVSGAVGDTITVSGTSVTFEVSGQDITVTAMPAYFDFTSSDQSVATVDSLGQIAIVGEGSADITGSLGAVAATGTVTVATAATPAAAAPTPTEDEADVISLFSDAYPTVPVNTWAADFSVATFEEVEIAGNAALKYSSLDYAGVEFVGDNSIDATGMTNFRMDIWTPDGTSFGVKLVDFGADNAYGGGDDTEFQVNFDGAAKPAPAQGQWVSLDIPLSDFAGMNLEHLSQLIIVGRPQGASTYYVDNVYFYAGGGGGGSQVDLPVTFDDAAVDYALQDFGGTASELVADPTDASNTVAQTVKSGTAETWAGTTIGGDAGLATAIPFTASATTMTVRVYSPDAGIPVRLKVENAADAGQSVETEAMTTVANAWETLTFDFSNEATGTAALNLAYTYDKASIFFNFGTDGATAGEKTYLWDDVEFAGGGTGPTQPDLPVTFDDVAVDYALTDFGGTASALVADPTDGSNTVAQTIKSGTAETWAGTTIGGDAGFASAVPFTSSATTMTVRVYSPDVGTPVRLKVENAADAGQSVETEATTTVADAWETLTFDFSNEAAGTAALNLAYTYDKASIFFNFGTDGATAGEKTYLWDDLEFGGGSTGGSTAPDVAAPTPTQAEADVISMFSDAYTDVPVNTWRTDWSSATLTDTTAAGDAVKKYSGLDFAGIEFTGANSIDASGMTHVRMDVWTPDATSFSFKFVDFGADNTFGGGDDSENVPVTVDGSSTPALGQGSWVSIDVPLSDLTAAGLGSLANLSQLVIVGQPTGAATVFIDNVYFYNDGGTGQAQVDLPVTFDDSAVDYALTDFGGTASTLVADPTDGSNTVAETVKTGSAETWAGTTIGGDAGFASAIPFTATATTMTVRVYSPDAGIPVRLKVEDAGDPTRSVETEATTTVANAWETLTFDFSNEATGTAALNLAYTYDKASIFFNFGTDGATAGEKTYLWDDVAFQP